MEKDEGRGLLFDFTGVVLFGCCCPELADLRWLAIDGGERLLWVLDSRTKANEEEEKDLSELEDDGGEVKSDEAGEKEADEPEEYENAEGKNEVKEETEGNKRGGR
ncbi:multidrug resistance-associated protein 2 [Striga asiatica]|uniref:Multidrug resistance-associated protein 2 n=1 Tax=Striga asiatica TaxID=4170 RepID=A0A5A7RBW8_STRAF|nr:multidrug resistance-associated protein 2 [Striga asiatica]